MMIYKRISSPIIWILLERYQNTNLYKFGPKVNNIILIQNYNPLAAQQLHSDNNSFYSITFYNFIHTYIHTHTHDTLVE